ncbi:hypothetical protein F951_01230 [Acinetobacter soli CIP 110264]|nr:contact-dependent growth inhibition system immunity protein [Acinetobacter soli]ENV57736.1 hypothetical protein F951_01230 [Acinetobacter soli CIP 110264]
MKMAAVNFNDQYLEVESWHQGSGLLNLDFERVILSLDVSNKVLGQSIIIALNAGKSIPPEDVKGILFSPELDKLMKERDKKINGRFWIQIKKSIIQIYEKCWHNIYQ